ncbi:20109_t:CDS:1, partial [Gigaspora margarita]
SGLKEEAALADLRGLDQKKEKYSDLFCSVLFLNYDLYLVADFLS